jgi:ferrous-iron efflux pump FieF
MATASSSAVRTFDARQARLLRLAGAASVTVALVLTGVKLWAWQVTDSVALLSSMADSLLDLAASLITFFAVRVALTPADREHRFGHGKSEAVAGLAQAVIVTGSAAFVALRAVVRLLMPAQIEAPAVGAAVMVGSLALTIGLVWLQRHVVRETGSLAIGADAVHYQSDILTGVAVLAAIALNAQLGWHTADPLLALLVVALILASVRSITLQALDVLLDRELPAEARDRIVAIASDHAGVLGVHDVRTRSAGAAQFIQLHLELDPALTLHAAHEISNEVETALRAAFPAAEVLIHADPYGFVEDRDPF